MSPPRRSPNKSRNTDADGGDEGRRSANLSRPLSRVSKFASRLDHLPVTTFGKEDRKMTLQPLPLSRPQNQSATHSCDGETAADALLGGMISNRSASPVAAAGRDFKRPVSSSAWAAPKTHVASTGSMAAADYLAARPWARTPVPDAVDYSCLLRGGGQQQAKKTSDDGAMSDAPTSVISRPPGSVGASKSSNAFDVEVAPHRPRKAEIIFRARDYAAWNGPRCRGVDGRPLSTFGPGHPQHVPITTLAGPGAYRINMDDVGDVLPQPYSTLQGPARGPITLTRTGLIGNCKSPVRETREVTRGDNKKNSGGLTEASPSGAFCRCSGTKNAQLLEQERRRRQKVLLVE